MSDDQNPAKDPDLGDASHADEAPAGVRPESGLDTAGAVLGAVTNEEHNEILAAADDPLVSQELADMEFVASELARLTPPVTINRGRSAGMRSRLVSRAAASKDARPHARSGATSTQQAAQTTRHATPIRQSSSAAAAAANAQSRASRARVAEHISRESRSLGSIGAWLAAAGIIAAAAIGGTYEWRSTHSETTQVATAAADTARQRVDSLIAEIASRDSVIASLTGPGTRVIELAGYAATEPRGRVFWNQRTNKWSMYAYHLAAAQPGRTYQLWMIARGHAQPIPGGTFQPDSAGSATMSVSYAMDPGSLRAVAVTDEPAGGSPEPTGAKIIVGAAR